MHPVLHKRRLQWLLSQACFPKISRILPCCQGQNLCSEIATSDVTRDFASLIYYQTRRPLTVLPGTSDASSNIQQVLLGDKIKKCTLLMHIRSYSKAQKGHGVRNEPRKAVLDALYQAACIEDLILVSTIPEAMSTKSVLTQIILHVPRTVHLPLHPSEAAQLYPLLDKLTSSITRFVDHMDLKEVGKILGVCRLMRFNPQHLLGALYPKFLSSEGSMSLSRLQVDASLSILDILPNLLTSLYALSKGPPDLVVDMLFSACCGHALNMQNRHLIFLAKWLNTRNAVVGRGDVGAHTTTLEGQGMNSGESVGSVMTCAQDLKSNQACWELRLSSAVSKAVTQNLKMFNPEELMHAACAVPRLPLSISRQEATRKLAHAVLPILIYAPGWQLVSMADAFASSGLRNPQLADAIAAEAKDRTEQRFIAPRGGTDSKQSGRTQQGGQNVEESLDAQALQKLAEAVMRLYPSEM